MFREMRRKRQALSPGDCAAVLCRGTSGVLAVAGDGGYPYAVPLSYGYDGEKLYFHCAKAGHKLDAIRRSPKVSFCVIDQDRVVPEEYTTYFRSVIVSAPCGFWRMPKKSGPPSRNWPSGMRRRTARSGGTPSSAGSGPPSACGS